MQVWEALGSNLVTGPIAAMVLHLSIGDTWNHINNVEKKLGVAVSVVFIVVSDDAAAGVPILSHLGRGRCLLIVNHCVWLFNCVSCEACSCSRHGGLYRTCAKE